MSSPQVETLSKMGSPFLPSHSIRTDSLRWADSEVRSHSPRSFVGDSQFPFSVPVCPDSQDVEVQRARPEDPSDNTLDSSEMVGSADMRCWDLAEGEPKSQSTNSRLVLARTLQCPPPSLDTQEFEIRYLREEQNSPGKCIPSPGTSSMDGMACWDLAEGEAISQDARRPLADAETPFCPPASLDSEEFMRRCAAEDILKCLIPAEDVDDSPVDEFKDRNAVDCEAKRGSPLQLPGEDNMPRIPLSPVGGEGCTDFEVNISNGESGAERPQRPSSELYDGCEIKERIDCSAAGPELALGLDVKDNVATVNPINSTAAALNDIRFQTHFNTSQHERIAASIRPEAATNEPPLDNKEENVSASAKSEQRENDTRSDCGLPTEILPQGKRLAAVQDGDLTSDPVRPLPLPWPTPSADTDSDVQHQRSKRKSQEKSLTSRGDILPTRTPAEECQVSDLELSIPKSRSPLTPISFNTGLSKDLSNEKVRTSSRQSCRREVFLSKGGSFENTTHIVASELLSSTNYPLERSNVKFREVCKEITTTSAGEPKTTTRFDAGEKSGSLDPTEVILQTSKRVRVHDTRPRPASGLDKNVPEKTRPVQTRVSSRVGVTSHAARVVKQASGEPEQDQGWLCPKASKSLVAKKPRQRVLDTWLK